MEPSYLSNVRKLLQAKDYEAVAKIEPQIISDCKDKLSKCVTSIEIMQAFLLTFESLHNGKQKNPNDPLPDYLLDITNRLMSEYGCIKIDDYKLLEADDVTWYCWKHKGKININPVVINKVITDSKVHIRYTHHEPPNGFEHTFKANNFKFAIRQLASPTKMRANAKYTFFFFNS